MKLVLLFKKKILNHGVIVGSCYLSSFQFLPLGDEIASVLSFASDREISGVLRVLGASGGHVLSAPTYDHLKPIHRHSHLSLDVSLFFWTLDRMKIKWTHVDVYVSDELGADVGAAVQFGRVRHVSVTVPLPAGTVGVAGRRGSVLDSRGCDDTNRLACNIRANWVKL